MLQCLVYVSSARQLFPQHELAELLLASRTNNAAVGVTGLLLHIGGNFMQVLEGEASTVARVYEKIAEDPRHHQVKTLLRLPTSQRLFGDWTMAFKEASALPPEVQAEINTFIDEVQQPGRGASPLPCEDHLVMRMLAHFAQTMR